MVCRVRHFRCWIKSSPSVTERLAAVASDPEGFIVVFGKRRVTIFPASISLWRISTYGFCYCTQNCTATNYCNVNGNDRHGDHITFVIFDQHIWAICSLWWNHHPRRERWSCQYSRTEHNQAASR